MHLTISQWGLLLDLIGVLLLFKFGLPSELQDENGPGLAIGADKNEIEKIRKHNKKIKIGAYAGLAIIFVGFALQFIDGFH